VRRKNLSSSTRPDGASMETTIEIDCLSDNDGCEVILSHIHIKYHSIENVKQMIFDIYKIKNKIIYSYSYREIYLKY
jgi:hypothetical protein